MTIPRRTPGWSFFFLFQTGLSLGSERKYFYVWTCGVWAGGDGAIARLLLDLAELNIQNYTTVGGSIATVSDGDSITVSYLE